MFGGLCEEAHTYSTGTGGLEAAAAGGAMLGQSHTPSLVWSQSHKMHTHSGHQLLLQDRYTHTHTVHTQRLAESWTGRAYTHAAATNLEASIRCNTSYHRCLSATTCGHHAHNNCLVSVVCSGACVEQYTVYCMPCWPLLKGLAHRKLRGKHGNSAGSNLLRWADFGSQQLQHETLPYHHRHKPPTST